MTRRAEHEDDSRMSILWQVRRVMVPTGQPIVRGFILDQSRLVRTAQPEPIAAVVGLVPEEHISRSAAFHTVVVGKGAVVLFEMIPRATPAIEHTHKDPIAAMRAVILQKAVVIRTALNQYTGGVSGMDLAW